MAIVYAAWHEELDRAVALKVLAEQLADDPTFRARFLREARVASRLQHPNLVRVFDVAELDGLPAIVLELIEGGTLEGSRLTLDEAAQIADGLAHAHASGVVHRDLKPANLLRAENGTVKIADFGIARAAEETRLTQTGTVLGTLRYLSPEQAEGGDVGPAADVYSLGVVLDELLDERPQAVLDAIASARQRDPVRRPSAEALAAALRGGTAPTATRTAATRVLGRASSRRLWPAVLLCALVGAAIAIAILVSSGDNSRESPARVEPVPHAADSAQQARNLSSWLRAHAR